MLSALTKPKIPNVALGIEKTEITALQLKREGRGRFAVTNAASSELPDGLVEPSFLERNISNTKEFAVYLEELVMSAGLGRERQWNVVLPANSTRAAIITLDNQAANAKETEEIIDWKAEQMFGAPASDLRITRQKISKDAAGKPRYFTTAVKLAVIDEYETIFENMGWRAGLIMPRSISEAQWLSGGGIGSDAMLLSEQSDGFTALLLRGSEPAVIRSVTCRDDERDDEIFRLLMFYNDRFASEGNALEKLLIVGNDLSSAKIKEISNEALGRGLDALTPDQVGLNIPVGSLRFHSLAAAAGLASSGMR